MNIQIIVQLDPAAEPPVTVSNADQPVLGPCTANIQWVRAEGQLFTFTSLAFASPEDCPITVVPFDPGVTEVTASDDNETPGMYPYHIVVDFEGNTYTSGIGPMGEEGDPSIENEDLPPTH